MNSDLLREIDDLKRQLARLEAGSETRVFPRLATSSTDNAIVRFDGTGGDTQNSGAFVDDNGRVAANGASLMIASTEYFLHRLLRTPFFTNGVAGLKCDVELGNISMWGSITVAVTGASSLQSAVGRLEKCCAVGVNPNNTIYMIDSVITVDVGTVSDNIFINDVTWSAARNMYVITLDHIVPTGNNFYIEVSAFMKYGVPALNTNLSISAIYL